MTPYYLDRRLPDAEIRRLAGDVSKIPLEAKDSLEARFMAIQDWDFYEGFMVAALDIYRHLNQKKEREGLGLHRVQFVAALILYHAGHLFRDLELPFPEASLSEKLDDLPPQVRTFMEDLLMDFPCRNCAYDDLEKQMPVSVDNSMAHYFQLDQSPLFYAGLFHGYCKLYTFLANAEDVPQEAKSDFAMSAAVFLADKILSRGRTEFTR